MAIPTWPTSLPTLAGQRSAFKVPSLYPAPQQTEFDDGPPISRRRMLSAGSRIGLSLVLTPEQLGIFKAFVRTDLNDGTRRFMGPVIGPDMLVATRTCKIEGEVSVAPYALKWSVSFVLFLYEGW